MEQVCAGFTLYGPATMLVLTTGNGVDGFTLDREIGAFVLTHPQMRIPQDTSGFAINAANERFWERPVRRYVLECLEGVEGPRGRDFNMRWVASLVADTFHILTRGGLYLYPRDTRNPALPGRVSLLYGANPIAFIVEQAGGAATTGHERMMEVPPAEATSAGAVHLRFPQRGAAHRALSPGTGRGQAVRQFAVRDEVTVPGGQARSAHIDPRPAQHFSGD